MPTPPPVHAPDRATLMLLSAVILVAVLVHYSIASPVIATYALIVWALKTVAVFRNGRNPPRLLVLLLTILSFVLVLLLYGGWNGQKAGISFLVLLVSLKFLESNTLRDYYMVCLILFFIASSSFLFYSSLASIFIVLGYTICITALLIKISNPDTSALRQTLASSALIMLKALPLALILFFFFPRIQGNFGFIPSQDEINSENQLNNSLVAGEFANGAFDNSPAFRVEFDGQPPPFDQRYWRVKVMSEEQNFQWAVVKPNPEQLRLAQLREPLEPDSYADLETYSYQIIHEDTSDTYLPFLDYALSQSAGVQLNDHSVYQAEVEDGIFAYRGTSIGAPTVQIGQPVDYQALTKTISQPKVRTLALLSQWRRTSNSDQELVEKVYAHFEQSQFTYSLIPPSLGDNPVEQFLFETQSGYCEHYASTFTILMRWLGIPARVVVGYQGGTPNQVGDYIEVRYSDAHAWSEVWVNGQWQRVDPTAAITPDRIVYGMDALLSQWDGFSFGSDGDTSKALANFLNPNGFKKAYRQIKDTWNNVGYQWNKWVVNYNFAAQRELLESLGLEHRNSLYTLVGLVFAGTILLMMFYFWQLIPKPVKLGEAQQLYLDFVSRFKSHKVLKLAADTPNEFAAKAKLNFPEQGKEIDEITAYYLQMRYGREPGSIELFKRKVKKFKLKSRKK